MKENRKLLKEILRDVRRDMTDEEVLNLLADSQVSASPENDRLTLGQRAADTIARFAGSWAFIFTFTSVLIAWMVVNVILAVKAFDPYPFILLNLVLSCVAAIQAPLIMMSQNRQEEKDRRRAENDYKVNLKTEIMIEDLYDKLNAVLAKQTALEKRLDAADKPGVRGPSPFRWGMVEKTAPGEGPFPLPPAALFGRFSDRGSRKRQKQSAQFKWVFFVNVLNTEWKYFANSCKCY